MEGWIPTDVNGETVWVQAGSFLKSGFSGEAAFRKAEQSVATYEQERSDKRAESSSRGKRDDIAPKPDQHGDIPPVAEGEVTTPTSSLRKEFEGWKSGIKEIITDNIELKLTLSAISMLSIISLFVLSHTRSV